MSEIQAVAADSRQKLNFSSNLNCDYDKHVLITIQLL